MMRIFRPLVLSLQVHEPRTVGVRLRRGSGTMWRLVLVLFLFAAPGWARTFYVDPVNGNNTNNGTSCATPWQNPPGTRTATDSGFWGAGSWTATGACGNINGTTCRLACGDTILLRGGATQTSARGGAWCIANAGTLQPFNCAQVARYYPDACGAGNPVTLRVATATEWGAACAGGTSSGNFVLNATGVTTTATQFGCGGGGVCGVIQLAGTHNGFVLGGNSPSQLLEIDNSLLRNADISASLIVEGDGPTPDTANVSNITAQHILIREAATHGTYMRNVSTSIFSDVTILHTGRSCWSFGGAGAYHQMHHVGFVQVAALNCDDQTFFGTTGNGNDDGFGGDSGKEIWMIDSTAADNWQRAYDLSSHPYGGCAPDRMDWHFRNFRALNNSRAGGQGGVYGSGHGNTSYYGGICSAMPAANCGSLNSIQYCNADADCTTNNGTCMANGYPFACCTGYHAGNGTGLCAAPGGICDTGTLGKCVGGPNAGANCVSGATCNLPACGAPGYCSCAGSGRCNAQNGCSPLTRPVPSAKFFLGGVIYKNQNLGFREYGTGQGELWNTTMLGDGWTGQATSGEHAWDRSALRVRVFNNIVQQRPYVPNVIWQGPNNSAFSASPNPPVSMSNVYGYATAASDNFAAFSCPGGATSLCQGAGVTFANIANSGFTDASDRTATLSQVNFTALPAANCDRNPKTNGSNALGDFGACNGGFNNGGTCAVDHDCPGGGTCTLHCDLQLATGSVAIDAGRAYLLTSNAGNAGTGDTVVNVTTNGGSFNPRDYFIDGTSFPTAVSDVIKVDGTAVAISTITPATCSGCAGGCTNGTICHYPLDCPSGACGGGKITVTSATTWASGRPIHLAYNGAAPDAGAFESGGPQAPHLISVTPVP